MKFRVVRHAGLGLGTWVEDGPPAREALRLGYVRTAHYAEWPGDGFTGYRYDEIARLEFGALLEQAVRRREAWHRREEAP